MIINGEKPLLQTLGIFTVFSESIGRRHRTLMLDGVQIGNAVRTSRNTAGSVNFKNAGRRERLRINAGSSPHRCPRDQLFRRCSSARPA